MIMIIRFIYNHHFMLVRLFAEKMLFVGTTPRENPLAENVLIGKKNGHSLARRWRNNSMLVMSFAKPLN